MVEHIKPERIANSLMQHSSFKGSYLIVEGQSDFLLYGKFINKESCKIKIAFGSDSIEKVIKILDDRRFGRGLGIIDADFKRITDTDISTSIILMTDYHDIELLVFMSPAFETVLQLYCQENKRKALENNRNKNIRSIILDLATPLAYLRWTNHKYNLGLTFKPKKPDAKFLKYTNFIKTDTLAHFPPEKMIETVLNYSRNRSIKNLPSKRDLINYYKKEKDKEFSLIQICNGHDITNILSISLKKGIGNMNSKECSHKVIENAFILAYDSEHFKTTELYNNIKKWEIANKKNILHI
ncbi:MAG: DUF4435 domain-containing protein [Cyclobacteriaceae bacterium]